MKTLKRRPAAKPRTRPRTKPTRAGDLEYRVLGVVAAHPGWDAEQIAAELGEDLFEVLDVVRALIERGAIGERA